ncbi:MAG: rhodanese-like domain-containing protein [Daejeonella sp.]|uniref:rhodanese-like domain-containing protein n=1 Tax=Daejeonella sp. TaxID=2805397 RepID=UPI003C76287A
MLKYILFIAICLSANLLVAQSMDPDFKSLLDSIDKQDVPQVYVKEFNELNKNEVFVLDVREEEEFNVSHLKNARHVGYFWFDMRKVYDIPKDAFVVLYCSIGTRSEKIAWKLIKAGYKNVYSLYGGIFEWVNSGQPVYKMDDVQTSEIHTYSRDWARWVEKGTKVN